MPERAGRLRLDEAIRSVVGSGHLLVASDFDGTLSPIVDNPDDAVAAGRALAALGRLAARPDVTVAIISGRTHADLVRLTNRPNGVVLIGEHGNDPGDGRVAHPSVEDIARRVEALAPSVPGSALEIKRTSVVFHYRNSPVDAAEEALARIRAWASTRGDLVVMEGKMVLELSIESKTKGDALTELVAGAGARSAIFIGDDVTDESVFEILSPGDVGVKVGPGDTAAGHRVDDVDAVVELLEFIEAAVAETFSPS